jgi:D-glycero-D-manno-heptose 1,7-bisphosphate phosphatase
MLAKVAFLDRDGTINTDHGYVYRVEDWQLLDGAIEGMRLLQSAGFRLAVVTNQSGIARNYYRLADVELLHAHMRRQLQAAGIQLDAVALCPHGESPACMCRKPRTGMAQLVEEQLRQPIDYTASWTIGDKLSDIQFGVALGTRVALIRSRYWEDQQLNEPSALMVDSLLEAARQIVEGVVR